METIIKMYDIQAIKMSKVIVVLILLGLVVFLIYLYKFTPKSDYITDQRIVRHGGGIIDGDSLSNSYEAIQLSYDKGYRFNEIDLSMTSDGYVVCSHGFSENDSIRTDHHYSNEVPDLKEFKETKIYGRYTPMTVDDLFFWLRKHRDVCIYLDVKEANYVESTKIVEQISNAIGKSRFLYNNILISARNVDMLKSFSEAGCFKHIHLWRAPKEERDAEIYSVEDFLSACEKYGVSSWSIYDKCFNDDEDMEDVELLLKSDMNSFVYMVRNDFQLASYEKMGFGYFTSETLAAERLSDIKDNKIFITSCKASGDAYIQLNWTEYGINSVYEVWRKSDDDNWILLQEITGNEYKDTNFEPGVLYGYKVKIKNSVEETPIYYQASLPKPKDIIISSDGNINKITWKGSEYADGYTVYRDYQGNGQEIKVIRDGGITCFSDEIEPGVSYKIRSFIVLNGIKYYSGYTKLCNEKGKS